MNMKKKLIIIIIIFLLLSLMLFLDYIINFILAQSYVKEKMIKSLNKMVLEISEMLRQVKYNPGYTAEISDFNLDLTYLEKNDVTIKLNLLDRITIKVDKLEGYFKFKYKAVKFVEDYVTVNINNAKFELNFNIRISPLKIDSKGSTYHIPITIAGDKWLYDKIIKKIVHYYWESINKAINEKFNELPNMLENYVRNLPEKVLVFLDNTQQIYRNRIMLISSAFVVVISFIFLYIIDY